MHRYFIQHLQQIHFWRRNDMSKLFKTVEKYYKMGFYSKEKVALFVTKGQLTAEEYELITGQPYEE